MRDCIVVLPPLHMQGRAGEGCFVISHSKAPPPNLPLHSQGEEVNKGATP